MCAAEGSCSSRYRTLRQCLAGRDRNTMLANKECQAALEVLQESPLYDCRCKRGMKKELQCLQIYWSIHLGLAEGEEFYEASPYEPVTSRLSDIFRLASIFSGMDPTTNSKSNHCLDAAKACNLNDNCKRLRSGYISTCSKEISATEHCSRRKCHKALRQFFDRVPSEYTYRLLFCSCKDQASRLADFHANCQASFQSLTSCPGDNYQACLGSYTGLIGEHWDGWEIAPFSHSPSRSLHLFSSPGAGFDMTPNYVDASTTSITISPWCSCKGSGNMEEECEKFLRDFTENPCLRNAIQAFGNGTDVNLSPKNPSPPITMLPKMEKSPALPDDINDSNTMYDTSIITTCTSIQEHGQKLNKSKEQSLCYSETQLTTDTMPDQKTFVDQKGAGSQHRAAQILPAVPVLLLKLLL
ncbi:hypothetical protein ASZ78_010831 [Callipepla squamata]|uniref:GDNF family receptor alpha-2 n=1 Tax=Callipepla squamata TaxID=9009 RepID=A0A226N5B5_CALSU|nr:hypothetical protein ASZ78_010831 [Callipepla squamata]